MRYSHISYTTGKPLLRTLCIMAMLLLYAASAHGVLKEKDLPQTLSILRHELETTHDEMGERQKRLTEMSERMRDKLFYTMKHANQNALMLYSQKQDYVFDLTYACHEATKQYHDFRQDVMPFRQWANTSDNEVARYDSLIQSLSTMPLVLLDQRALIDRNVCLTLAVNIRRMVKENQKTMQEYMSFYLATEQRLKTLYDYAQKRYADIQSNIFVNGDDDYITILGNLRHNISESRQTVADKYVSNKRLDSQWDASVIMVLFGVIVFYGLIAVTINQVVMRLVVNRLIRKKIVTEKVRETYLAKRACIVTVTTAVTFAVILFMVSLLTEQNFILMASNLLIEFVWLMCAIMLSILVRADSHRTMQTIYVYSPLLFMGFVVITFRIVLIPNALVNIIFPPMLLAALLWQWRMLARHKADIDKNDRYYAYISTVILAVSVLSSWTGYTLLSVQLLIWWVMQLTCILSIKCINDWLKNYAKNHDVSEKPITSTWAFHLISQVVVPVAAVASVLGSIYWAADVFNLTAMTRDIFMRKFIDSENFVVSMMSISQVIILFFTARYIHFVARSFIFLHYRIIDPSTATSRSVMVINVVQVLVYGVWFLISLAVFHVSNSWIVVISGGLSTGVGFASKDILENIYYGISLMAGRIKIGDIIVCDGTRGRVSSISYTSTMIEAVDGSVIAFTNSQLFTKNYKNLTRRDGYEVAVLEVGVAYGTDLAHVRNLLSEAIAALPCVDTQYNNHKVTVMVKELADSCVTLKVVCWVDVVSAATANSDILECIYNTLNSNNIEIPFPQQDIHIRPSE